MAEILLDNNPWNHYCNPINPSRWHTVLFELPCTLSGGPPRPHRSMPHLWAPDYVRIPFSPRNLYPAKEDGEDSVRPRWELIQTSLLRSITNSNQLEEAIHKYNMRHVPLVALHQIFQEILEENEAEHFFNTLLPKIVQLALQLPELLPAGLPLLRAGNYNS